MMDGQVEGVFLDEEVFVQGVAVFETVVEGADVAAGAEGLFASPAQDHGIDAGVIGPGLQLLGEAADHVQGNGVQAGRAIEGEVTDMVTNVGQYLFLG